MSDILFSHSYYYRLDPKQWKNRTPFPPLGTLYAASLMRQSGYSVALYDTNLATLKDDFTPQLERHLPKYLVIYDDGFNYLTKMCLTAMREACFRMILTAKAAGCKIIVSSSDSTDHVADYLSQGADYVLIGEGEMALADLTNALEKKQSPENVAGIAYLKNNEVHHTAKRPVLQDLDVLPLPAWDLVDVSAYRQIWLAGGNEFTLNLATTRGCPYKCNWCAKPIYGNRYNSHSPQYVANHIQFLSASFGVKRFWMCDDIFGLKPNWVNSFRKELDCRALKISYYIQSRVDLLLKENTIDDLAASGLEEVWVGAESASQKILDAMDKGTTVEQIYTATALLRRKKIRVAFFLQFGYPGENADDISKTIDMVKTLAPDNIGISVSYPLPGTKFHEAVKADLKLKQNWRDSDDLEMMFNGSFKSAFYKKLQRFVHKEYRKNQGFLNFRQLMKDPTAISIGKCLSIAKLGYYIPSALIDGAQLKKMQHEHEL